MELLIRLYSKLKSNLTLSPDKEDESVVVENIRQAVNFRGVTLWILIFAVLIASIGLNVDSAHIVIGAMLISPLMTPIIGVGLAVGINDMELMKRSMRNLLIAALFAIFAAVLYFFISPLDEARSELLSRTSPTLYDVIVALIGGAAGFLALITKGSHIQVVIGVALSTALLPPLCTVGYGIATSNWLYAIGALYLFFINSVFIALATFLCVRLLGFTPKVFADKQREKRVRRMIIAISLVTLLPSILLTYNIVRKTIYLQNAQTFVAKELNFPNTQIIEKQINYSTRTIETVIVGNEIPRILIEDVEGKLPEYNLKGTHLRILQSGVDSDSVQPFSLSGIIARDIYARNKLLETENGFLRDSLMMLNRYARLDSAMFKEVCILFPQITELTMGVLWSSANEYGSPIERVFVGVEASEMMSANDSTRLSKWMFHRINSNMQLQFLPIKYVE